MEDGASPLLPWSEQLTKWLHEELPHLAPQPYRVPSHGGYQLGGTVAGSVADDRDSPPTAQTPRQMKPRMKLTSSPATPRTPGGTQDFSASACRDVAVFIYSHDRFPERAADDDDERKLACRFMHVKQKKTGGGTDNVSGKRRHFAQMQMGNLLSRWPMNSA